MVRVCERTSRAVLAHEVTPMARMIVHTPRARTADSTMASTSEGSTRKKSTTRMSTAAPQPR
jgi:hypothetical protein